MWTRGPDTFPYLSFRLSVWIDTIQSSNETGWQKTDDLLARYRLCPHESAYIVLGDDYSWRHRTTSRMKVSPYPPTSIVALGSTVMITRMKASAERGVPIGR
jgi:hypothetical protein